MDTILQIWKVLVRAVSSLGRGLWWPFRLLFRLTREGMVFAVFILICFLIAMRASPFSNMALLIALALLSLWVLALFFGGHVLARLDLVRHGPERAFAGQTITFFLSVQNRSRFPAAGLLLTDYLMPFSPEGAGPAAGPIPLSSPFSGLAAGVLGGHAFGMGVPGRGRERLSYSLMVRRRGYYRFARTWMATRFPFGLWISETARAWPGSLVVFPRLGRIEAKFFQEMETAFLSVRNNKPSREEWEFRSLREFRHGDNPHWIHWRSSARLGQRMLKEFEEPQTRKIMLILDTNLQGLGPRRHPAFEWAISFTATAARDLLRKGYEVIFLAQAPEGQTHRLTLSRERRNLDQLFEILAGLRPDSSRTLASLHPVFSSLLSSPLFILVAGLGSLRCRTDWRWLGAHPYHLKVIDIRGEEFRRMFRKTLGDQAGQEEMEEEIWLALDEDGGNERVLAGTGF